MEGFFDAFRDGEAPTLYDSLRTPVTADVLEAGLIYAGLILTISLLLVIPGIREWGDVSLLFFLRFTI